MREYSSVAEVNFSMFLENINESAKDGWRVVSVYHDGQAHIAILVREKNA